MSRSEEHASVSDTPVELPLFPLNTVLFPGGPLPLRIFEPRYVDLVRRCMPEGKPFGVVQIKAGAEAGGPITSTADVGTAARIIDFTQLPEGLLGVLCVGERRFRLLRRWQQSDGLNVGEVQWLDDEPAMSVPDEYAHLAQLAKRAVEEMATVYGNVPKRFDDAAWVGYRLAELMPMGSIDKQACLELQDPLARLAMLSPLIRR